jgi:hypothetical protein
MKVNFKDFEEICKGNIFVAFSLGGEIANIVVIQQIANEIKTIKKYG